MPVIKTKGSKPGAKRGSAVRASKPAAKPAAKRTTGAKRRAAAKPEPTRTNRSPKTDLPKSEINATIGPLTKAGKERKRYEAAWKEQVAETNRLIVEALDKEIPVNMIVNAAQVSRQHVYKIIADIAEGKRTNGGEATGKAGRPPAQKARTSRGIGGATAARKARTGRRAAASSGRVGQPRVSGRPTIRTR